MKKIRIAVPLILSGLTLSSISLALVNGFSSAREVKAASPTVTTTTPSTVSLPSSQDIDLGDLTDAQIRSYYSSAAGLSGTDLLKQLKTIIITNPLDTSNPAQYYSYSNVRKIYKITDRQWSLYNVNGYSGSNSISNYSSSTNKITGFSFGDDPYLHFYYRSDNETNPHTFSAQQTKVNSTSSHSMLCQEHLWSKSLGFSESSGVPNAGSDLHHLVAADYAVNSWAHSNLSYGVVTESVENNDFYANATNWGPNESPSGSNAIINNKVGTPANYSEVDTGSLKVFEPQDSDKGDIARALLYMVARYNWLGATDQSSVTEPYLELVNKVINQAQNSSAGSGAIPYGCLNDLLTWHFNDLPDQYEIHRNNIIYKNFQHTRNPFIDFPEFATYIWGRPQNNPNSSSPIYNYSGSASPSSDTINALNPTGNVSVTGVTLDQNTLTIGVGGTAKLVATIAPANATNKNVTWTSSDTSVATVSLGTITAKKAGTTTITVTTADGSFTASCTVTVDSSSIAVTGVTLNKATLTLKEEDVEALTATISPNNATNKNVTWSSSDDSVATVLNGTVTATGSGTATITVTTVDGSFTASCTVTVTAANMSLTIEKGDYASGYTATTGTSGTITKSVAGTNDLSISYSGINTKSSGGSSYSFTMYLANYGYIYSTSVPDGYYPSSITVNFASNTGESGKIGISYTSSANSTRDETVSGTVSKGGSYSLSNADQNKGYWNISTNGANVQFASISLTYSIIQSGSTLSSISLDTTNVKTSYIVNEEFSSSGLVVTAHYSDDTSVVVSSSNYTISEPNMTKAGTETITVTYESQTASFDITISNPAITSITATVNGTYYVGDIITKSDITVKDNYGDAVTDYSFPDYQFTYSDASSGGALTDKTFTITYNDVSTTLTTQVQRRARVAVSGSVDDTITKETTGASGNTYIEWSNKTISSTAVYSGNNAGSYSSVQLRSATSSGSSAHAGIISTASGGKLTKVTVVWNSNSTSGRSLSIYGKNTAYSEVNDLWSTSSETKGTLLGSITYGTSTELTIEGDYEYVGLRATDGAIYLTSITISYADSDTATNLANYIMYEDIDGQCNTKFSTAKGYFEGLSKEERATFMNESGTDYVINTARARLKAWADYLDKTISFVDGDYVISATQNVFISAKESISFITILSITAVSVLSITGFIIVRKRKETN